MKVRADAIVHPTNGSFYMGGEVGRSAWPASVSDGSVVELGGRCLIGGALRAVIGSAIEKAGGKPLQDDIKALSTEHGTLDIAEGIESCLTDWRLQNDKYISCLLFWSLQLIGVKYMHMMVYYF